MLHVAATDSDMVMDYLENLEIREGPVDGVSMTWQKKRRRHNACRSKDGTFDLCIVLKVLHTYIAQPWHCGH